VKILIFLEIKILRRNILQVMYQEIINSKRNIHLVLCLNSINKDKVAVVQRGKENEEEKGTEKRREVDKINREVDKINRINQINHNRNEIND